MSERAWKEGDAVEGFTVLSCRSLSEYRSCGIRLVHEKTGAEVYHMLNDDTENLFSFNFRTPPTDSTGVPHILEHAVLAGSRRFPVKDPFVALLKGSMQTFLNAMTFPDKTAYPASSQVEKDFYNLMLVYGDAVFFPLLKEEIFKQEGHHLEFTKANDVSSGLKVVGVVYNEMQGNYSSPESIAADWSFRCLFPDTPYGVDSGGNPQHIPELTYEEFIDFHRRYYHPSNCKIFLYGNIATEKHLAFLEEHFLEQFSRVEIDSTIPFQPRWAKPRQVEKTYPVQEKDAVTRKSTVIFNWLSAPITAPLTVTGMKILAEALIGNAGSPLRKALIESQLGEDIAPSSGLETELKELVFSVGLRGTDPRCVESCERVILETLCSLRDHGLPEDVLQGALQRVEFSNREIAGGRGPYGLKLMRKALQGWLHDIEPEMTLKFSRSMEACKEAMARDNQFFTRLLDEQLINNPHRCTFILKPDPKHMEREAARQWAWLKEKEDVLSQQQKQGLLNSVLQLKLFQQTPDPPEQSKKIPFLTLRDLPRQVQRISSEETILSEGVPLYLNDVFTNGIVYIDFAFNTELLPVDDSRMLPLLAAATCGSGLPGVHYSEIARRLSRYTGGFTYNGYASGTAKKAEGKREYALFRLKVLHEYVRPGLDLVKQLLAEADFGDHSRLKDLLLELKNDFRAALIPNGHQFVSMRAGSALSKPLAVEERWKGIAQMMHLAEVSFGLDHNLPDLAARLEYIRTSLLARNNMIVNVTGERQIFEEVAREIDIMASFLAEGSTRGVNGDDHTAMSCGSRGGAESFAVPTTVGYVAKAIKGARVGTAEAGYEAVLSHLLRTGYLWERVRMQGGAYGAFATPYHTEGVFIFASYRDPNIVETLRAYREALTYAKEGAFGDDQIEKAIIGTVGKDEKPIDPGNKGLVHFKRKLAGITDELRQEQRQAILRVNREALSRAAVELLDHFDDGAAVVLSHAQAIRQAGETMKELGEHVVHIPA